MALLCKYTQKVYTNDSAQFIYCILSILHKLTVKNISRWNIKMNLIFYDVKNTGVYWMLNIKKLIFIKKF